MRLLHEPLKKAAEWAVEDLRKEGGAGGVIAVDSSGNGQIICVHVDCNLLNVFFIIQSPCRSTAQACTGGLFERTGCQRQQYSTTTYSRDQLVKEATYCSAPNQVYCVELVLEVPYLLKIQYVSSCSVSSDILTKFFRFTSGVHSTCRLHLY